MKLIKNALIAKNRSTAKVDILFDEKIRQISEQIDQEVDEIIDLKGKLLIPGCIDSHVHFNQPGFEDHENFFTGTQAAAAGGITTVVDMPCTSLPPVTNLENLQTKLAVVQPNALIDFAFWGGIRANDLDFIDKQLAELWDFGVVGFKIYTISGMPSFAALSYDQISELLSRHKEKLFAFHAEDPEIIAYNEKHINCSEEPSNYSQIRSIEAEQTAVNNVLKNVYSRIHFVHISSQQATDKIIAAKAKLDLSWETCPHYLQFTAEDFNNLRGRLKTAPPVKYPQDRDSLNQSLIDGTLDFITTDHAGSDWETEKDLPDFNKAYNGIPGTQLMIPFLVDKYYQSGKISLARLIELTSANASKRYGLYPNKGSLQIGTDADFTIIDLENKLQVDESMLLSKGKYSPFVGKTFDNCIDQTVVRGETIFDKEDGIIGKKGFGKLLLRR